MHCILHRTPFKYDCICKYKYKYKYKYNELHKSFQALAQINLLSNHCTVITLCTVFHTAHLSNTIVFTNTNATTIQIQTQMQLQYNYKYNASRNNITNASINWITKALVHINLPLHILQCDIHWWAYFRIGTQIYVKVHTAGTHIHMWNTEQCRSGRQAPGVILDAICNQL